MIEQLANSKPADAPLKGSLSLPRCGTTNQSNEVCVNFVNLDGLDGRLSDISVLIGSLRCGNLWEGHQLICFVDDPLGLKCFYLVTVERAPVIDFIQIEILK